MTTKPTKRLTDAEKKARSDYWNIWIKPYLDEARAHIDPYQDQGHYDGQ